jgi:hypothetical protein
VVGEDTVVAAVEVEAAMVEEAAAGAAEAEVVGDTVGTETVKVVPFHRVGSTPDSRLADECASPLFQLSQTGQFQAGFSAIDVCCRPEARRGLGSETSTRPSEY